MALHEAALDAGGQPQLEDAPLRERTGSVRSALERLERRPERAARNSPS